ncbi:uncharacterized protein IL334_007091 [Kwoniella shivajii]|uniref:Protein transporter SEC13 n=1 Tax=Kwoniella shivajii TaxID=564305 RepID=A0ABZ1D930_9TREE|nr:hypothetical protein IL334_007091 [Kwoniella shivajii]
MASAHASKAVPVETQHEDMIHDAQLDYYGKRLATCSSDKTIRIFNVVKGEAKGEPVILKGVVETVNSIAWAPYDIGPILACASSDGKVSVLSFQNDGSTDVSIFPAHGTGANAVSWAPSVVANAVPASGRPTSGQSSIAPQKRFVTAGSDNLIRIWGYDEEAKKWIEEEVIKGHEDWVRDVAWAPNIGLPGMYIASASQDRTVLIHTRPTSSSPWSSTPLLPSLPNSQDPHFPDAVWRVSWSLAGNILAVSCGDGKVSLWKEGVGQGWECVSDFAS